MHVCESSLVRNLIRSADVLILSFSAYLQALEILAVAFLLYLREKRFRESVVVVLLISSLIGKSPNRCTHVLSRICLCPNVKMHWTKKEIFKVSLCINLLSPLVYLQPLIINI